MSIRFLSIENGFVLSNGRTDLIGVPMARARGSSDMPTL